MKLEKTSQKYGELKLGEQAGIGIESDKDF